MTAQESGGDAVCGQLRDDPARESEHVSAQRRFDVFAIQSDDQVLYVVVVQCNSFDGYD
jgi:hypothetical protein